LYIVKARRERLAAMVAQHGFLPVKELCRRLDVSEATARRDLIALQDEKKIKRTYGGAITEFDSRFPSFTERRAHARSGKEKIAATALSFITPGSTLFFDNGTTVYSIAEALCARPVIPIRIVTSSIPVVEILAAIAGVDVFLVSGQLLPRQSVLIGEMAIKSLAFWRFDLAFLSAEGMNDTGIWNSQAAVVEQQKAVLRRSGRAIFCIDGSKLNRRAPHFLMPWSEVDLLLTEVPKTKLGETRIKLRPGQYCHATGQRHQESPQENPESDTDSGELPVHVL
jgi:DeoR/GlpR family transcriptional regulator of sugar metabolism